MYEDFKNRVCEGRGIHPDVINLIAGGRVMTGLKAFELNAPEDLIKQIKGLDLPPTPKDGEKKDGTVGAKIQEIVESVKSVGAEAKEVVQQSPVEKGDGQVAEKSETKVKNAGQEQEKQKELNRAAIVVIDEDQDTSPYAPPQPVASSSSSPLAASHSYVPIPTPSSPTAAEAPTKAADPAAHNAEVALATSSPDELITPSPAPSSSTAGAVPAAGLYQVKPGPFGRGLIDGIGGIRDAMVYACELFVSLDALSFPAWC